MAVFAWAESASTSVSRTPRIAATKFGDGYEETAPDGLNVLAEQWSVVFRGCSKANGTAIEDFFRARLTAINGLEAFDWWPLWATAAIKVKCRTWSRTQGELPDESDISATFERVYLP